MSQLDISIFYSHLFCLLLSLYIFSHIAVVIVINYFYNLKVRELENEFTSSMEENSNNTSILIKILD